LHFSKLFLGWSNKCIQNFHSIISIYKTLQLLFNRVRCKVFWVPNGECVGIRTQLERYLECVGTIIGIQMQHIWKHVQTHFRSDNAEYGFKNLKVVVSIIEGCKSVYNC
jgi:hypothetical protein